MERTMYALVIAGRIDTFTFEPLAVLRRIAELPDKTGVVAGVWNPAMLNVTETGL
jgi:hypothetical protein